MRWRRSPLQYQQQKHVLVLLDGTTAVPGLVLKCRKSDQRALVTYELDGKVATDWIAADQLQPLTEPPSPVDA